MVWITLALVLGLSLAPDSAEGGVPYLYGEIQLPQGLLEALPQRAQEEGIPLAVADISGELSFTGVASESELLGESTFLILDGAFFVLGVQTEGEKAFIRGVGEKAEVVAIGDDEALGALFSLMRDLGLLQEGFDVGLSERSFPEKVPAPPQGLKLDPVLWGLLIHPDWFAFAGEKGIERVGIRVKVVAEVKGLLPERYEGYIQTTSDGLAELLIPIPLLDDLAREETVKYVRLPAVPHPIAPVGP